MEKSELINGADPNARLMQLVACIPDVFDYQTVLYVGAGNRLQMFDHFVDRKYEIDIVEVFLPNVMKLGSVKGIRTIYNSDIRYFRTQNKYDVVFFWHGIEHIQRDELLPLTNKMKTYANKLIVLGMPYGEYEQGTIYDNPYEEHVTAWYPEDFPIRGFKCDTIGMRDSKRSNLIAWKRI